MKLLRECLASIFYLDVSIGHCQAERNCLEGVTEEWRWGWGVGRTGTLEAIFAEKVILFDESCSHCFVLCIKGGGMYECIVAAVIRLSGLFEMCLG